MQKWYLICTKPGQEALARESLQGLGYACFLPLLPGAGQTPEPLFPRYLFVQLQEPLVGQAWAAVRAARGVARIVSTPQDLDGISHELVQFIRSKSLAMASPWQGVASEAAADPRTVQLEAIFAERNSFRRVLGLIELISRRHPPATTTPAAGVRYQLAS